VTAGSDEDRQREEVARRRRRAEVFGEALPERAADESGERWNEQDPATDEWLRRQVPPHHG
jgi:hypothetical protein